MKKITALISAAVLSLSLAGISACAQTVTSSTASMAEQNTMSVLWYQTSGEAKALYYQGYNVGKMRLDEILNNWDKNKQLKPAIVLDLDETVIDNSPLFAGKIVSGENYPLNWSKWEDRAAAKPLPGALEFLNYADSKGVAIFYITNRKEAKKAITIKNLQAVGVPQATPDHVFLKQKGESGKENRRQQVAKTNEIVLLFGDNLGDFSGFDELSVSGRIDAVTKHKEEFGRKLIVFPNPMYGDWEGAIYNHDSSKSVDERLKLRKESLQPFQP
ncbi:5'-nucleotidase, lipoprotein e(P4) family [Neobacillus vireti]|uniref:Acid phosphatase n=1 Tax=Neobacillus vireti LMG 21834 TaxID=1131730 RepID=A0AB94IKT8_9BACI|nr:5'-nucleotidase, lipoprotein e(P4) family [Neobacillus vireti]ETI67627.1 acid phosphatase [Neobacillus vireti LMG 21834]KLT19127.1 5'-nucleotidase [Neobacillus vireti]